MSVAELSPVARLIHDAIKWADWCAGQGICSDDGSGIFSPDEFLMGYADLSSDLEFETLPERIANEVQAAISIGNHVRDRRRNRKPPIWIRLLKTYDMTRAAYPGFDADFIEEETIRAYKKNHGKTVTFADLKAALARVEAMNRNDKL